MHGSFFAPAALVVTFHSDWFAVDASELRAGTCRLPV
jgi:hypothetical protein